MVKNVNFTNLELKHLESYCQLNNLNEDVIIKKCYLEGFLIEKYGLLSGSGGVIEKEVIKEVIKYVEVPVVEEKEVVKIEYVDVEKLVEIVKEVPVEKIVEVIKEIPTPPQEIEVIKYVDREVVKEVIKEVFVSNIDNIYDKNEDESVTNLDNICDKPEPIIVEKIVEVIKEVPVEVEVVKYVETPVEIIKEIEVIQYVDREVIKEVPVEIIKEKIVNVIQEVPVPNMDKIWDETQVNELLSKIQQLENRPPEIIETIKEVMIESNDSKLKPKLEALQNTVQKLKLDNIEKDRLIKEYEKTIQEIQKFNEGTKAMYLKGSNLDDKLYNK